MSIDTSDRTAAWAALHDPATPPEQLAAIAAAHAEFAEAIGQHPHAYPELRAWAEQLQHASTPADPAASPEAADPAASPEAMEAEVAAEPASASAGPDAAAAAVAAEEPYVPFVWEREADAAPAPASKPSWWSRLDRRRRTFVLVGAGVAVLIVAGGAGIGIASAAQQRAADEAAASFEWSASTLQSDAATLAASVESAGGVIAATPDTSVADPQTLTALQGLIDQAAAIDSSVPAIADATDAVNAQVAELDERASEIWTLSTDIDAAVVAVQDSVQALVIQKLTPSSEYSIEATDGNGNKERITVRVGSWVKGSDAALLDQAWGVIGGEGAMPLSSGPDGFTADDGAFLFGTIRVENLTPDFPAENFGGGTSWVYLKPLIEYDGFFTNWRDPSFEGLGATYQARQYGSGASYDVVGSGDPLIKPDMSGGDLWGPVPFVIGLDTVFTPNDPNGNPKLDQIHFSLSSNVFVGTTGDTTFQVGKSW